MWKLQEIKNNKVHKDMLKLFAGKRILFLENSNSLHVGVGNFEIWLRENKMEFNALFDVGSLSMDYIKGQIEYFDVIAFQTTWTYEVSRNISEFLKKSKDKKIIVESCIGKDPTWFYKPKGVVHDMYMLQPFSEDMDDWEFKKLRLNKATWED